MKLSVDSRGWMWAALLLLAASYTAQADGNDTAPAVADAKNDTSPVTVTVPPSKDKDNSSTVPPVTTAAPVTPHASTANPTKATTQAPTITTMTTKAPVKTTKAPVKTTSASATTTTTISPVTSSISATLQRKSGFDVGSFVGGIVLTLCLFGGIYYGCRLYSSKRGVRYRTIDEHEAII